MKIYSIEELLNLNFNVKFVNALKQNWQTTRSFQCIGNPKTSNLFLYLNECKITYIDKNGRKLTATDGDIVYTPLGSEYKAYFVDSKSEASHTVGINFYLFTEDREPIILSDEIMIFPSKQNQALKMLFRRALQFDTVHSFIQNRILLMEILSHLTTYDTVGEVPGFISDTLEYMAGNLEENPTVALLAKRCNLSEVYFRKQFKSFLGSSPSEYRRSLRLGKARSYLEYGDISVQEISDTLVYATVSHFIKEFKKQYGYSPLRYRRINRQNDE